MKRQPIIILFTLLFIVVSACQPTPEAAAVTETPQATATLPPPPTSTPTEIPIEAMTAEQLLEKYLALDEQLDTTTLTNEQRTGFSEVLAEYKNEQRGANPAVYNGEAYIDPEMFQMRKIEDGRTKQQQTIVMFLPVSQDTTGNLLIKTTNDEWITITDSQGVDWNMVVTDQNDPRIDWPPTKPDDDSGLPFAQWLLSRNEDNDPKNDYALIPIILLDKKLGGIFLEGRWPRIFTDIHVATIETDIAGNPICARLSGVLWGSFNLFEEGSDVHLFDDVILMQGQEALDDYLKNPMNKRLIAFWETLEENQVYYMSLSTNQVHEFESTIFANFNGWKGLVPLDKSYQVLTGQAENDKDLIVLEFVYFLKNVE